MKLFICLLLCCLFQIVRAQQENKFRWATTIQAGAMHGSSTDHFHLEAITGLLYKTWQAGAGAGLDYYYWRTLPVFIHLAKNLTNHQQTPFVALDLGMNFPWIKEENDLLQWQEFKYHRGFYGKAEAGYRFPVNSKSSIHISAGYSRKVLHADKIYYSFRNPGPPYEKFETSREYFSFYFNRISFSAGLTF